ncbi:MAG: DNA-processing protein DprA [Peptococcaceae bacterium]|nr:MAG: DNA-processing protein DprA [Peptococcaceae bacterium]
MNISPDGQVILLLCSDLAIPKKGENGNTPFTLREWNEIARKLSSSSLKSPEAFLRTESGQWQKDLGLSNEQVKRIERLLSRSGNLAIELERLASLGVWIATRIDSHYPYRLKTLLKQNAPVVLFGAGNPNLFDTEGVAIVGARDVDEEGAGFTERLARKCAQEGLNVVSGGARGVDRIAQESALAAGGKVVAVLADSLEAQLRYRKIREAVLSGCLTLLSPYNPAARFTVGSAMCRNKYIYVLSKYAVVVSASYNKGGTWAGAVENLKYKWVPLFVRPAEKIPEGNRHLILKGGIPFRSEIFESGYRLRGWLEAAGRKNFGYIRSEVREAGLGGTTEPGTFDPVDDALYSPLVESIKQSNISTAGPAPEDQENSIKDSDYQPAGQKDIFDVVWPYIEKELSVVRTEQELAKRLKVRRVQMQDWLKKAQELGKVHRTTKPVGYISTLQLQKNVQPSLFDGINE